MSYDLEKYRTKREKVLGVKKRGLSFQIMASLFALLIIVSAGFIFVPDALNYMYERNLDDAIYKLEGSKIWSSGDIKSVKLEKGVEKIEIKDEGRRLVLTFNRKIYSTEMFELSLKRKGLKPVLLNKTNHSGRKKILMEEKEFETI